MNQASKSDAPKQQGSKTTSTPSKLRVKTSVKSGTRVLRNKDG